MKVGAARCTQMILGWDVTVTWCLAMAPVIGCIMVYLVEVLACNVKWVTIASLKVLWCHNIQVLCHSCDADRRYTNDQNSYIVTVIGILQTNHGDYFSNHLLFTSGVINSLTLLWTISMSLQDCDDVRAFGCSNNMHINKKPLRL
jgi:hypothetical protein